MVIYTDFSERFVSEIISKKVLPIMLPEVLPMLPILEVLPMLPIFSEKLLFKDLKRIVTNVTNYFGNW